jgi:hypothetical protein
MKQVTLIKQTLHLHLGWHGARVTFLALFLIALFRVKSVNLAELATGFFGSAKLESSYKRLQRFMGEFELDYHRIARLVAQLDDGKLLIVITHHRPHQAIADYGKSWGIKTLFGCLKTRGFCLESTHLKDPERLSWMIALLTIALC